MKVIGAVIGFALLVISGVMISLVYKGGALKPAGVIKPAEIGTDPDLIGRQIAIRLFPEFQSARVVVWRLQDNAGDELVKIPQTTLAHLRTPTKPELRTEANGFTCATEKCWFVVPGAENEALPEGAVEIFIRYFDRDEKVSAVCEAEQILGPDCMKPVAVREVRRKLRTAAPHYFMQRYMNLSFGFSLRSLASLGFGDFEYGLTF
jgi:hypothetical protein